jgi:ribokinase
MAAEELLRRGAGCAVIKMGAQGAYYATAEVSQYLPAFRVQAVDTVAAGDAFNGALAVALAEGRGIDEAMRRAMAAGALAVTRTGAQDSMPSREELDAFLSGR